MRSGVLMLVAVLVVAGHAAAADPPDAEGLAEQGAGIEEILDALDPGGLERVAWRMRATSSGLSTRVSARERGVLAVVNRSSSMGMRSSIKVEHEGWALVGGGWSSASDGGLLQVGGGRVRLPGAGGAPVATGVRIRADVSAWRARPVDGGFLAREGDGWQLRAGEGREGPDGRVRVLATGWRGNGIAVDAWALERNAGRAGAMSVRLEGDGGGLWGEGAWTGGPGRPSAVQSGAVWRWGRGWRVDAAWAAADAGFADVAAGRSPLIPGEAGWGWAARLTRGGRGSWRLALLIAGGTALRPDRGPDEQEHRDLVELRGRVSLDPGTRLGLRLRWRGDARFGWEEREVWQAPSASRRSGDLAGGLDLRTERPDGEWRLALRGRRHEDAAVARHRLLLSLGRDAPAPGGVWRLRAAVAWGDALALTTVAAPAPGAVVLEHWGRRVGQTSVGWRGRLGTVTASLGAWWSPAAAGGGDRGLLLLIRGRAGDGAGF